MANQWFLIDCYTFWKICGTTKNRLNLDSRTPHLSPKYFNEYRQIMGTFLKHLICQIWEYEILKILEGLRTIVWSFAKLTYTAGGKPLLSLVTTSATALSLKTSWSPSLVKSIGKFLVFQLSWSWSIFIAAGTSPSRAFRKRGQELTLASHEYLVVI